MSLGSHEAMIRSRHLLDKVDAVFARILLDLYGIELSQP